jgi:hypothetical protein
MSIVKPTRDAAPLDKSAIAGAVALLVDAAGKDFASVEAQLKAAGFGITGYLPLQARPDLSVASDIGELIEGRGIYHGDWQPSPNGVLVHAYSETDLLKDASGEQLLLTWYKAREELARRNNGRSYGDGAEEALCQALAKPAGTQGAYKDGDLVIAPLLLLNGRDVYGNKVRDHNTIGLRRRSMSDAFKNIAETLQKSRSGEGVCSWSCSGFHDASSVVRVVRLSDGCGAWSNLNFVTRFGVLPFRFFREPHAVKAVSHLTL